MKSLLILTIAIFSIANAKSKEKDLSELSMTFIRSRQPEKYSQNYDRRNFSGYFKSDDLHCVKEIFSTRSYIGHNVGKDTAFCDISYEAEFRNGEISLAVQYLEYEITAPKETVIKFKLPRIGSDDISNYIILPHFKKYEYISDTNIEKLEKIIKAECLNVKVEMEKKLCK